MPELKTVTQIYYNETLGHCMTRLWYIKVVKNIPRQFLTEIKTDDVTATNFLTKSTYRASSPLKKYNLNNWEI